MNYSQCPKCGQADFRLESITPHGSDIVVTTVICSACYSIAGTVESINLHDSSQDEVKLEIEKINKKLEVLYQSMEKLANGIKHIYDRINKNE